MADGRWQMADGRWQMADGRWQMADGRWQMADGRWQNKSNEVLNIAYCVRRHIFFNFKSDIRNPTSEICHLPSPSNSVFLQFYESTS
jgi:hypothetical protein